MWHAVAAYLSFTHMMSGFLHSHECRSVTGRSHTLRVSYRINVNVCLKHLQSPQMAPLTNAIEAHPVCFPGDIVDVFGGKVDPSWTVAKTPHGGYILACLVQACVTRQADSSHPDPIHVTNYFLRGASIGPYEVHMRTVRAGKSFTNMTAELIQEGSVKLSAHLMFGVLDPALSPPSKQPFELLPPDAHARPTPFHTHPSLQSPVEFRPLFPLNFRPYLMRFEDPSIVQHHERLQLTGTGPGGRERGSWYRLPHAADTLTPGVLAFFADVFEDTLPPLPSGPLPLARFPTLLMSVEFKAPIPRAGGKHCTRTVGSYTACRFVNEPLGRHNIYLELWTAPAEVEAGRPLPDGWRDEQRCLLIANHMSLVGPVEVGGHRNASFEKPRL